MLEWQLGGLQSSIDSGAKHRTFGVQYYSLGNAGLQIADIAGTSEHHPRNLTTLQKRAKFRGLVVILCKMSETLHGDISRFCEVHITPTVAKEKIPFILCLYHAGNAFSENIVKIQQSALDITKKATETLRASLEKTHWI